MIKQVSTYKLPDNLEDEIKQFEIDIEKFKSGEMSDTEFKVQRVPFGCYEQRKKDTYMVRIRCGGSIVTPEQLERIAEISKVHAADYFHLTTRQEVQLHYVLIDSLIPVIRSLKEVGLSPRGGGGNTVRNIMAQEDAGIAEDEAFDVSPYAIALTSRFVSEPDSWNLPRKFKITFSGSSADRNYATIHDIGYIAKMKDGQKGFTVYFAGGLGAKTQIGLKLFDFIPDTEVYNVAKAIKTLFYKNGNRKNKHAARLRYLVKTLGEEELKRKFFEEYEAVKAENHPPLEIQEIDNSGHDPKIDVEEVTDKKDFELWKKRFVNAQKQDGLFSVVVPIHLGHIDNDKGITLAQFLKPFGDNTLRVRKDQNLLVRNIPEKYLTNFYNLLKNTFENFNRPFIVDKVIACAGASTCQLGICLSPGAATATKRTLEDLDIDLDAVSDAKVNISGCPNSCGQHHVAELGFFGRVNRKGDKVFPAYNVISGGIVKEGETELATKVGEVAARDLPNVVQGAFKLYLKNKKDYATFSEYVRSEKGKTDLTDLCKGYKEIPEMDDHRAHYFDWGTDKIFSVAERGKGECSAGIFDLIENDLGKMQQSRKLIEDIDENGGDEAQRGQFLRDIVFYASRVLLVSKALQPRTEQESYNYFREHFINGGLVNASFDEVLKLSEAKDYTGLIANSEKVYALGDRMKLLYDVMNPAFQFVLPEGDNLHTDKVEVAGSTSKSADPKPVAAEAVRPSNGKPDVVKDFRGIACPMNFVKTKMELSKLAKDQVLEIFLDDGQPIDNVPGSVRGEGHKILDQKKIDNYWSVTIKKQ